MRGQMPCCMCYATSLSWSSTALPSWLSLGRSARLTGLQQMADWCCVLPLLSLLANGTRHSCGQLIVCPADCFCTNGQWRFHATQSAVQPERLRADGPAESTNQFPHRSGNIPYNAADSCQRLVNRFFFGSAVYCHKRFQLQWGGRE